MKERYHNLSIEETTYRLNRMTPQVGSWILSVLLSATARSKSDATPEDEEAAREAMGSLSNEERAASLVEAMWLNAGASISEEVFYKIQVHALNACAVYPSGPDSTPIPVATKDGRVADKTLEEDLTRYNRLVMEALKFNLCPFFLANMSKAIDLSSPSKPLNSPTVTGSSSAQ